MIDPLAFILIYAGNSLYMLTEFCVFKCVADLMLFFTSTMAGEGDTELYYGLQCQGWLILL